MAKPESEGLNCNLGFLQGATAVHPGLVLKFEEHCSFKAPTPCLITLFQGLTRKLPV